MKEKAKTFFFDLWGVVSTCTFISVAFDVQVWMPLLGGVIALGVEYLKYRNKNTPIESVVGRLDKIERIILSRPCILESELNCGDEEVVK